MKKLTLKTKEGCCRLIAIFIIIILVSGLIARAFQNDFGKIKVEQVTFDSRGALINAELYYPVGTNDTDSLPGIVVAHGGGCTLGVMKNIASELARRGFVVLNATAFGTGLSEQPDYDEGGYGVDGFDMNLAVNGLYDSLCYLRSLKFVDATRIATIGHSMGSARTFAAAIIDAGYLSVNDQMLNYLYDLFGVEISEDQINDDADEIAENNLNEDELRHYYSIKDEIYEIYNTRVRAEIMLGAEGDSKEMQRAVTVAGHEVVRSLQTNIAYICGDFDFQWGFTESEHNRSAWYSMDGFNEGDWYAIDDATQTSVNLGEFGTISIVDNSDLAEAIENRSTRALISTGPETHSKELFSTSTINKLVNYLDQALDYNRGKFSDGSATPLAASNQIWIWREIFNFIALLSTMGLLVAMTALIIRTKKFQTCISTIDDSKKVGYNKTNFWITSVATVILSFIAMYLANKNGIFFYDPSPSLPLGRGAAITIYFVMMLAIAAIILLAYNVIVAKKTVNSTCLKNLNVAISIRSILKCFVLSVVLIIIAYTVVEVSEYMFGQDLRFWMVSLSDMKAEWWVLGIRYSAMLFPLYLVISISINHTVRTDIPEWKDTLITVIVNSLGVWICCAVNYVLALTSFNGTLFSSFICSYQFLFWVPLTVYIARKMYNLTKNVWTGAFLNTFIICWSMMCTLGVNDGFWGQNWISNFFNI
jgi:hypothetical protein